MSVVDSKNRVTKGQGATLTSEFKRHPPPLPCDHNLNARRPKRLGEVKREVLRASAMRGGGYKFWARGEGETVDENGEGVAVAEV
jgi:hypothetical protein